MFEAAAIATWLFDPTATRRMRVSRCYSYRYSGQIEQLKYGRRVGRSAAELEAAASYMKKLENEVRAQGYQVYVSKSGKKKGTVTALCEPFPTATDLIDKYLHEGKSYGLLSGVAHAKNWALSDLFLKQGDAVIIAGAQARSVSMTTDINRLLFLAPRMICSLARPLWALCAYFGMDALRLEEILEVSADRLGLAVDPRFWRTV
jgi:hypothetical protein